MGPVMAFVLYLFVLLLAAGGVLFGLDVVTSPLTSAPNVPIGRSVRHIGSAPETPNKIARRETTDASRMQVDDRALSPVYPASPGPSAPVVTARNATKASAPQDRPIEQASVADDDQSQHKEEMAMGASAEAALPAHASCNVQACSAAYRTFTSEDCTYQPFEGPRKLCTKSRTTQAGAPLNLRPQPTARAASRRPDVRWTAREMPRRRGLFTQNRDEDASETARIVLQMTRGRPMGDIAVQRADGSIIIVHTGQARAQAYR
jgi:hypothetical protein